MTNIDDEAVFAAIGYVLVSFGSPSAVRIRSVSRAVFAVVVCGSTHAVREVAHCSAMARVFPASHATSAAVCAYGGKLPRFCCSFVRPQFTDVLRSAPRGSKPITS